MRICCRLGVILMSLLITWNATAQGLQIDEGSITVNKLGLKVRKFAESHIGKKVDTGECSALAVEALKSAGAKTTYDYGVSGLDKDYKWGTLVTKHADVQPGDIIQYRDVKLVTKTTTKLPNGGIRTSTQTKVMDHHTAIITFNQGGGKFKVLEQNVGDEGPKRKTVQEGLINLSDKISGSVWIYRPVKK